MANPQGYTWFRKDLINLTVYPGKNPQVFLYCVQELCKNIVVVQYWPSRGTETYGVMCVTLTDTQELATYVIRTFQLQRVSSAHVRHLPHLDSHQHRQQPVLNHHMKTFLSNVAFFGSL